MSKNGGDFICKRPDGIIEARFKLTKKQNDIMDMVFASIKDDDNLEYEINLLKYINLYNLKDKTDAYSELKKAAKTFEGKGFSLTKKISEKKEHRIYFSWFSSIEYMDGEGKIKFELGKKLKTILIEAKRAVFYNIEYTLKFDSIYSKRIYYYLKLYEDTGFRIDKIDDLRNKLDCPSSYEKYSLFKKKVLQIAYEEINGNSDISFEFEEVKEKNKVVAIKFYIKSNKKLYNPKENIIDEVAATKESNIESIDHQIEKVKEFTKKDFTDKAIAKFLDLSFSDIDKIKKCYEYMKTKEITKSKVGYMNTLIKNWEEPETSSKGTGFNNFEPRNLDDRYIELRNKILSGQATEEEEEEFYIMKNIR